MIKKMVMLLVSLCLAICLAACGEGSNSISSGAPAPSESVASGQSSSAVGLVPYAVENNLVFSQPEDILNKSVPYILEFTNEQTKIVEERVGVSKELDEATYKILEIRYEPAAKEGFINAIITTETNISPKFTLDEYETSATGNFNYRTRGFGLADYYTGRHIPSKSTAENDEFDYSIDLEWEGTVYPVGYTLKRNDESYWGEWEYSEDWQFASSNYNVKLNLTYTITMPQGYDGLVLFMPQSKPTDDTDFNIETEIDEREIYILDKSVEEKTKFSADEIFCVRVIPTI